MKTHEKIIFGLVIFLIGHLAYHSWQIGKLQQEKDNLWVNVRALREQIFEVDENSVHTDWYYEANYITNFAMRLSRIKQVKTNTFTAIWYYTNNITTNYSR